MPGSRSFDELTGDADTPLELRIRETAAPFAEVTAKKRRKRQGRKEAPAVAREDRGTRLASGAAPKLKAWRRAVATKQGVPAFRIMSDRVLLAIAEKEPATAAELLAIPGIGIKLVEKYASQIYRILDESRV